MENIWCTDENTLKRGASKSLMHLFQWNDPYNFHSLKLKNIPSIHIKLHDQLLLPVTNERSKMLFSLSTLTKLRVQMDFNQFFSKLIAILLKMMCGKWCLMLLHLVSYILLLQRPSLLLFQNLISPKFHKFSSYQLMQCAFEDYFQSTSLAY